MNCMLRKLFSWLITFLTVLRVLTGVALASDIDFGPDLASSNWNVLSFPFKRPIRTSIIDTGTLEVIADHAAGMIWHALPSTIGRPRRSQWSWRVDEGVGVTDLSSKGADDRAIAIYFIFGQASDREMDAMSLLNSKSVSALVYVYGSAEPRGAIVQSPHMGERGKFIILRPANSERKVWLDEKVDLQADFHRAFGRAPPELLAIAISSDSDDTGGINRVRIRRIDVRS